MTDIKQTNKTETKIEEKKLGRRTPLYAQKRVGVKERPGFTRRLVNEVPGRVEAFLEAGWTPVEGDDQDISDSRIQNGRSLGTTLRPIVNKRADAPCTHGVWMEIPTELYEEDQRHKRDMNNRTEESYNPEFKQSGDKDLYGATYSVK